MSPTAIIIGSGISGLTAAAILNRKGFRVKILEKRHAPGGALQRFKRRGADFDVGFHYSGALGDRDFLTTLWRYLGISNAISVQPFPDTAAERVKIHGTDLDVRAFFSYEHLARELTSHFPEERAGIKLFLDTIRSLGQAMPPYGLTGDIKSFLQSLAFPEKKSLADLLNHAIRAKELQAILSLPVFLHGVNPEQIGLTLHASVAHSVYSGMYSIDKGGRAIVDAFTRKLAEHEVEIRTNINIEQIIVSNGRVAGVRAGEEEIAADIVIHTGHPLFLLDLAPPGVFSKAYTNRLKNLKNTNSMFIVFGTLRKDSIDKTLLWNNYYAIPPDLDMLKNKYPRPAVFLSGCGGRDTGLDGEAGPGAPAVLMRPAEWQEVRQFDPRATGERAPGYRDWKKRQTDELIRAAECDFPYIMRHFNTITSSSPLTLRDELSYPQGAVYGVQHGNDQFHLDARTKVPGLWLSGQNVMMPGIIGASLSALVTTGHIVGLESLWREVIACA